MGGGNVPEIAYFDGVVCMNLLVLGKEERKDNKLSFEPFRVKEGRRYHQVFQLQVSTQTRRNEPR